MIGEIFQRLLVEFVKVSKADGSQVADQQPKALRGRRRPSSDPLRSGIDLHAPPKPAPRHNGDASGPLAQAAGTGIVWWRGDRGSQRCGLVPQSVPLGGRFASGRVGTASQGRDKPDR
jgi:hypothetical protein